MLSVEKFSRWLRAICTILLSRNSAADRTKAIGYVEQAVGVLQEHAADDDPQVRDPCAGSGPLDACPHARVPQGYPMDERHWLMGTAYNTGIECLQCVARFAPSAPYPIAVMMYNSARHYWTRRRGGSRPQRLSAGSCQRGLSARRRYVLHRRFLVTMTADRFPHCTFRSPGLTHSFWPAILADYLELPLVLLASCYGYLATSPRCSLSESVRLVSPNMLSPVFLLPCLRRPGLYVSVSNLLHM